MNEIGLFLPEALMKWLKKTFFYLVTGTFTMILSSCYGGGIATPLDQTTLKMQDSKGDSITGLECDLYTSGSTNIISEQFSDTNGTVVLNLSSAISDYYVTISDVDGTSNFGEFQTTNVPVSADDSFHIIVMQTN
jgi:hypothetical protein